MPRVPPFHRASSWTMASRRTKRSRSRSGTIPTSRCSWPTWGSREPTCSKRACCEIPCSRSSFPVGPKQLEATLKWPIEVLWERPRRVAAARFAADRVAAGLEQVGLTLVSDVKIAYVEYALAQDRLRLADQSVDELEQISTLMESRFQAGDISQLEARTAAIDAARARQDSVRARLDVVLRANELRTRLGLALDPRGSSTSSDSRLRSSRAARCRRCSRRRWRRVPTCAPRSSASKRRRAVSAGSSRAWSRCHRRVRCEWRRHRRASRRGPASTSGSRSSTATRRGARAPTPRSGARAANTSRHASASPPSCATPPRSSSRQPAALAGWRDTVLVPLEEQVQVANRAFADGDVAYLFVLEMQRRLTDARLEDTRSRGRSRPGARAD